jgi:hypothetical protein
MIKSTPLYRETCQRIFLRVALDDYNGLVRRGMLTWEAYKERRLAIDRSIEIIRDSIRRYKERRLQAGLFYLVPCRDGLGMNTRSHLFRMPLGEALKKRRQEIRKWKQLRDSYNNSKQASIPGTTVLRSYAERLLMNTFSSIILGCALIFTLKG